MCYEITRLTYFPRNPPAVSNSELLNPQVFEDLVKFLLCITFLFQAQESNYKIALCQAV